jgi:hypothetical protein
VLEEAERRQYLLKRNPKILHWLVEEQSPFFEWTKYPVGGWPTSPR